MNKDNEPRGFNPKQRIIGAVILVVLAIVIVPLVLNKRERPVDPDAPTAQTVITDLPAGDTTPNANPNTPPDAGVSAAPTQDVAPVDPNATSAPTAPAATGTIPSDPRPQPPAAVAPSVNAAPATPAAPTPPTSSSKTDSTRAPTASAAKGWYVQVGTFANPANAQQLVTRLQKAGFKVVQERVRAERNTVVRVRVGPYGKEAQAKTGQARIQKAVGIKGLVRHY